MSTLNPTRLRESIAKITESSFLEDSFNFMGVPITLRSLSRFDYDAIQAEMATAGFSEYDASGTKNVSFVTEFCIRHLTRSIVQIGPDSFRGVDTVLDSDGYSVEIRAFLRKEFLELLSWESFGVLWDKFNELVTRSEQVVRKDIVFSTPNERPDEKLDRLLREASEVLSDVPESLVKRVLAKYNFPVAQLVDGVTESGDASFSDPEPQPVNPPTPSPSVPKPPIRDASSLPLNLPPLKPNAKTAAYAEVESLPNPEFSGSVPPVEEYIVELPSTPRPKTPSKVVLDSPPSVTLNPRFQPRKLA